MTKQTIRANLKEIEQRANLILKDLPLLEDDMKVDEIVDLLDALRICLNSLNAADSTLSERLFEKTKHQKDKLYATARGAVAEIKKKRPKRKHDDEMLKAVLSEKLLDKYIDDHTGLLNIPISQIPIVVFDYVQIAYWRKHNLKNLGIDLDKYIREEEIEDSGTVTITNYRRQVND